MGPDLKALFLKSSPKVHDLYEILVFCLFFFFLQRRENDASVLQNMYCKEDKLFLHILL